MQCDGTRAKPSKEIEVGAEIRLRQGFDERTVVVSALSEQRRGAPEAQRLYAETAESIKLESPKRAAQEPATPDDYY